jgi:low affinity Fe/Cu permease
MADRTRPATRHTRSGQGVAAGRQVHASQDTFGHLATEVARHAGKPLTFLVVIALVAGWALAGPMFNYSETWLLFVNTAGTIVTVLMVFLIQNTQNRDTLALQLKLAELILVMEGTEDKMALAEDLSHEDLEELKEDLRDRAERKD